MPTDLSPDDIAWDEEPTQQLNLGAVQWDKTESNRGGARNPPNTTRPPLEELPEVVVTPRPPAAPWSEVVGEVPAEVGRQVASGYGAAKETVGFYQGRIALTDALRAYVIPQMVKEQKERGGLYWEQPSVVNAAKMVGIRPDNFVPGNWESFLDMPNRDEYARKNLEKAQRATGRMQSGREIRETARQVGELYQINLGGDFNPKNIVFQTLTSLPQTALGVGTGIVAGPEAGVAVFAGTAYPQFLAQALDKGLPMDKALGFAGLMSASEVVTEVPLIDILADSPTGKALMRRVAGKYAESMVGKVGGAAATEGVMEALNQAIQIGIQDGTFDEHTSLADALKQIAQAGLVGATSGATLATTTEGARKAAERLQKPPPAVPRQNLGAAPQSAARPATRPSPESAELQKPPHHAEAATTESTGQEPAQAVEPTVENLAAATTNPQTSPQQEVPHPAQAADTEPAPASPSTEAPEAANTETPRVSRGTVDATVAGQQVRVNVEPSAAQLKAGNYQKGHIKFQGLDIAIENPKGSERLFTRPNGKPGRRVMSDDYGYVKRTEGADGDAVDVFIGPDPKAPNAFVIDQLTPDGTKFDEHKVILGANSEQEAADLYLRNYQKGWKGLGAITPISMDRFKTWVEKGVQKEPLAWVPPSDRKTTARQPQHDSLLEFIAKTRLHGAKGNGLSIEAMSKEGLDPADLKVLRGTGITRPFSKNGGASLDAMAEVLAEHGYPVTDRDGNYDPNILLERIDQEIRGEPVYSIHKQWHNPEEQRRQQIESFMQNYEPPEKLFEVPDDQLDNWIEMLQAIDEDRAQDRGEGSERIMFSRGTPPKQADLFGDPVAVKNELQRLMEEKDRRRNSGAESADLGVPGDLFSRQANRQTDITDNPQTISAQIDALLERARRRIEERTGKPEDRVPDIMDLNEAERTELHRLKSLLPSQGEQREAAKQRLAEKTAQRKADQARAEQSTSKAKPISAPGEGRYILQMLVHGQPARVFHGKVLDDVIGEWAAFRDSDEGQDYPESDVRLGLMFDQAGDSLDWRQVGQVDYSGDVKITDPDFDATTGTWRSTKGAQPKALVDAGEKIGGARKDLWAARGMTTDDLSKMSESEAALQVNKAAVWKPDYNELIEAGMPVETAAGVKVLWDKLAAKPRENTPEGRPLYITALRVVRDALVAARSVDDLKKVEKHLMTVVNYSGSWREGKTVGYNAFWSIQKGRRSTLSWGWDETQSVKKLMSAGFPNAAPWTRLYKIGGNGGPGTTARGIELYKRDAEEVGTPLTDAEILAGFYTIRTKSLGKVLGFATSKEQAEALAASIYEREKAGPDKDKPPERPHLDTVRRTGNKVRTRDAVPEDFLRDFGFRGIEFGNWAANDERQKLVNLAYDALHDLATVLGIPPRALALDGTLGLALGARGIGGALAHYEPGKLVINMTKINGAGSLAHEWGHALDHYFGELERPDAYTTKPRGASGWYQRLLPRGHENLRPAMADAFKGVLTAMFQRDRTKAEAVRERELRLESLEARHQREKERLEKAKTLGTQDPTFIKRLTKWLQDDAHSIELIRKSVAQARGQEEGTFGKTDTTYRKGAINLSGKKGESGYWARPTEMFARAFESFVFDELAGKELVSEYLVHGVEADRHANNKLGNPYPAGEERERIDAAFRALFDTIQTRDGEKGVALFHTESQPKANEFGRDVEKKTGVHVLMYETHGDIKLAKLEVPEGMRGLGFGSAAMRRITQYADERGMRIILDAGTVGEPEPRLRRFYQKFGFFENRGRLRDFQIRENMVRLPVEVKKESFKVKEPTATFVEQPKKVDAPPSQLDIFAAAANPKPARDTLKLAGRVGLVEVGTFKTGITQIRHAKDAAHLLASLRKNAQENFLSLVLDENEKPIAVLRTSIGTASGASVEPWSLLGAILSMPGARSVYFAHNHPSGMIQQSQADEMITNRLGDVLEDSGVRAEGMLVFGAGNTQVNWFRRGSYDSLHLPIPTANRTKRVPLMERKWTKLHPARHNSLTLDSGNAALAFVKSLNGRTGIILLDARHRLRGFLEMSDQEMRELRTNDPTTGIGKVMSALHAANSEAVMLYGSAGGTANVHALLASTSVRVVDSWFYETDPNGEIHSAVALDMHAPSRTFYHRAREAVVVPGEMTMAELVPGGTDELLQDVMRGWALVQFVNFARQKDQTAHLANLVHVPTSLLQDLPETRRAFNEQPGNVDELVESMRKNGFDQRTPILVTVAADGSASIFDGNHRARAAAKLGLPDVPVRVVYLKGGEKAEGQFSPEALGAAAMASTERFGAPTDTKAFRDWFKQSKVVDGVGKPLVQFHGTASDFTEFDRSDDIGFHFGTINAANDHIMRFPDDDPRVMPVYLSIQNPLRVDDLHMWEPAEVKQELWRRGVITTEQADATEIVDADQVRRWLEAKGYDGLVYANETEGVRGGSVGPDSWVALRPEQVKSAIGNEGTFDPKNPNILRSTTQFLERNLSRAGAVRSAVRNVMGGFQVKPQVSVVEDFASLPREVFQRIGGHQAARSGVNAFIDFTPGGSTIYMVADRLRSDQHVAEVLAHEMTHYGLEAILDQDEWNAIAHGVLRDQKARVAEVMKRETRKLDLDNPRDQALVVHEVLAYMNQKRQVGKPFDAVEETIWNRLVRAFRAALARLGLTGPAYNDKYIGELLDSMTAKMRIPAVQAAKGDLPGYVNLAPLANRDAPVFYSAVVAAVDQMKTAKASGDQWWNTLRNRPGIKPEELEWLGLEDWLKSQDGPVTKESVQEFVRDNQIQVHDFLLGASENEKEREQRTTEFDRLNVELTALGYHLEIDQDDNPMLVDDNSGEQSMWDSEQEEWVDENEMPVDLPEGVPELARRAGEAYDDVHLIEEGRPADISGMTRYGQFTLPGGKGYRELLLTLPDQNTDIEKAHRRMYPGTAPEFNYRSPHWMAPNVVAHVRFKDRTDASGKRVLFVEEIQSDWHQQGRDRGYKKRLTDEQKDQIKALEGQAYRLRREGSTEEERAAYFKPGAIVGSYAGKDEVIAYHPGNSSKHWSVDVIEVDGSGKRGYGAAVRNHSTDPANEMENLLRKQIKEITGRSDAPPDGPFKTSWAELAFKRVLRWAAEHGYDRIAWTTGLQQSMRYNLWHVVDEIEISQDRAFGRHVQLHLADGKTIGMRVADDGKITSAQELLEGFDTLEQVVGKEMAARVMAVTDHEMLSAENVSFGGAGMKTFYDEMLPSLVGRITKKWGGKVSTTKIDTGTDKPASWTEADTGTQPRQGVVDVHSVDVTDQMRQAALQGLPLFHREDMATLQNGILKGGLSLEEDTYKSRAWNWLVFRAQDKFNDVLRLQNEAKKFRDDMAIPEKLDAYMRETLYHGRTEYRFEQYDKDYVQPLLKMVKGSGYTYDQVEQFLYARHAPEANAHIKKITEGHPELFSEDDADWHSGMTDEQAAAVMASLRASGDFEKLEAIGTHVDRMTKFRRDILVADGLETPQVVGAWEAAYQHYVPLKGWADRPEKTRNPPRGTGFDTGRRRDKRRTGRKTLAGNILANIVAQTQATIIMAEKAKVGRAFLDFAKTHPSDLYEVNNVEMERYFDESSGLVKERPVFRGTAPDNLLRVKVDGRDQWIEFNEDDPQAMRMARAFKNLQAQELNGLLSFLLGVNRFLATVNTSLNPEFLISNLFRDLQTALINMNASDVSGVKARVIADWRKAVGGILNGEFGKGQSEWAQHFEDFKRLGAKTGWIDFAASPLDLEEKLKSGLKDGTWQVAKKGLRVVRDTIDKLNMAVENAIRLSVFVNARREGLSDDKAAELAKNLTINFNRKGDWGQQLNAWYLFYNAAAQGTAVVWNAMKNKNVRRVLYGMAAIAAALQPLNRLIAGDDDDGENRYDKIPEYERATNLIIMLPKSWRFLLASGDEVDRIKIPLPYGYNMVYYTGAMAGDVVDYNFFGFKRELKTSNMAVSWLSELLGAFNPLGSSGSLIQSLAPTIADPLIALHYNETWYGGQIHPEPTDFDVKPPAAELAYKSASDLSRLVAHTLNEMTGGSDITPGWIDKYMPPYPDSLDYLGEQVYGGLGRFAENMGRTGINLLTDPSKIEINQVPFARKLLGQTGERYTRDTYYAHQEEVRYYEKEKQALDKLQKNSPAWVEKGQYITGNYGTASRVYSDAKGTAARVDRLREEKKRLQLERGQTRETKRKERMKQIDVEIHDLMFEFNKKWNTTEDAFRQPSRMRGLFGSVGPLVEGKTKPEAVAAVKKAGYPALAKLMDAMPFRPRPAMSNVYREELAS